MNAQAQEQSGPGTPGWDDGAPWIDHPSASVPTSMPGRLQLRLASWAADGYVILRADDGAADAYAAELAALGPSLRDRLLECQSAWSTGWTPSLRPGAEDEPGFNLRHMHAASSRAAALSLSAEAMDFLEAVFDAPPAILQSVTYLWRTTQRASLDYDAVTSQRRLPMLASALVALGDAGAEAKPRVVLYPGAHRAPLPRGLRGVDLERHLAERHGRPRLVILDKGDILVRHAAMPTIVRGAPDGRPPAEMVTHYTGLPDFPERWLPRDTEAREGGISLNGGYVFEFPWDREKSRTKLPSWSERGDAASVAGALSWLAGERSQAAPAAAPPRRRGWLPWRRGGRG